MMLGKNISVLCCILASVCIASTPSGYIGVGVGCFASWTKWIASLALLLSFVAILNSTTIWMKLLSLALFAGSCFALMATVILDRNSFQY